MRPTTLSAKRASPANRAGHGRTPAENGGDGEHNGEGFDHFDERKAAVTAGATVAHEIKWSSASVRAELPVGAQLSTGRWQARGREQLLR